MTAAIDAHVHLWDPARGDYGWLTSAIPELYRRFDKQDLRPLLDVAGIDAVVLVQAAPTAAESDYLLSIAERTPWIAGVVGWVDFDARDVEDEVARRAAQRKFVGVRPMLQDICDVDWIVAPERARALSALSTHELVFDALIRPEHISRVERIARRHPDLSIVIDHAAKPVIANSLDAAWHEGLSALAACPNVVCKLSGLLTQLEPATNRAKVLDCARTVLKTFGAARVIWGSDWPVLTLAASYDEWRALTQEALEPLSASDRDCVMGGNAARIYKLELPANSPAILLHPNDNVLVCRRGVTAGERLRISAGEEVHVLQDIDLGHKLARRSLLAGEKVIKYGIPIGSMTAAAPAGGWIHLHNMKSDYISVHTRAQVGGT